MLKTRFSRALSFGAAVTAVLDVALAYGLASWLSPDDFWTVFLLCLALLWIAPLAFKLKDAVYKVLIFFLTKDNTRRSLVQEFRQANLPLLSDAAFNDPADLYFQEVGSDVKLPSSAVCYANATLGQLVLISRYSLVDTVVSHANLDAALAIYFDEMRRDGVQPHGQ